MADMDQKDYEDALDRIWFELDGAASTAKEWGTEQGSTPERLANLQFIEFRARLAMGLAGSLLEKLQEASDDPEEV